MEFLELFSFFSKVNYVALEKSEQLKQSNIKEFEACMTDIEYKVCLDDKYGTGLWG
jgi:hypothetical protein